MKRIVIILLLLASKVIAQSTDFPAKKKYVLVIHGGAGNMKKGLMPELIEKRCLDALNMALDAGQLILSKGGSAVEAVEAVVKILEDDPLFNAGKGSVFNSEGRNEMDAAIMNGQTLAAGSVAGVTTIKNPISAARAVMEKSPHVMLTGTGAEKFANQNGLLLAPPSYFFTERSWQSLLRARVADSLQLIKNDSNINKSVGISDLQLTTLGVPDKFGTVGAVALDGNGNLAAATSTGGMTNKKYGRVGDSPIIGAGTYADNKTVAISCTGHGEYFMRLVMAKTISDMMEFGKMSVHDAVENMIMKRLPSLGGNGGLIAVDSNGNIVTSFCTEGMFRGSVSSNGSREVKIYKE